MRRTARISPIDWFFISAARIGAVENRALQRRAGEIAGEPRLREIGAIGFHALHLGGESVRALERGIGEIGFDQPRLIENGAIEFRAL